MALDNLFLIASKQLRQNDFSGFVFGILQGNFGPLLNSFIQGGGYLGPNILYVSGGNQTIVTGDKTFLGNVFVNYSGQTGSAPSQLFVTDQIAGIQTQINATNLAAVSGAHLTGTERFVGQKYFEKLVLNSGSVTGELTVPTPINSGDAVPLIYLQNQISSLISSTFLNATGNQMASGIISFFNGGTVYVPLATNLSGATPLTQLDSTGNNILNNLSQTGANLQAQINALDLSAAGSVTGFGGVLTFNTQSGNLFTQGRGTVTCTQNGNILNVSGNTLAGYTGVLLGATGISNGVSRQFIPFGQTFGSSPHVFASLENSSGDPFLDFYVSGRTTSGFNVVLSNSTATSNYGISYIAYTGLGSIVNVVQGPQGVQGVGGAAGNNVTVDYYAQIPVTGSGVYEKFLFQDTTFSQIQLGAITVGPNPITGNFYQRATDNTKTNLIGFSLTPPFLASNVFFATQLTAFNTDRIGIDILSGASGYTGLAIQMIGVGN